MGIYNDKVSIATTMAGPQGNPTCSICRLVCLSNRTLRRHVELVHNSKICEICDKIVSSKSMLEKHIRADHQNIWERGLINQVEGKEVKIPIHNDLGTSLMFFQLRNIKNPSLKFSGKFFKP